MHEALSFVCCIVGINAVLNKINCDRSAIDEKLGASCDNRESIIMAYVGLVEHRTNEMLTIQSFLDAKVIHCAIS